jgi:lipopolysaccharide biosynthesis regulator YciM
MMTATVAAGLLLLAAFTVYTLHGTGKKRGEPAGSSSYLDALHLLLDGKTDEAAEELKRTVQEDSDNIMAYVTLGNILRGKGFPIQAAKIHRNLLIRNTLTERHIDVVLRHLVLDYQAAGMPDKAVETAERLIQRNKKNMDIKRLLLALYEEKGDWDKAYFLRQSLNRWMKKRDHRILALYRVMSGTELVKKGAGREGRIRFREAIKLHKDCIPAYLFWGDSYRQESRDEDAYHVWMNFVKSNHEWAHLAFDRLNGVLFDLGRYGEMEAVYQEVMSKKPGNPTACLNLVDIYKKQGKIDEALDLCGQLAETHSESARCTSMHMNLLALKGRKDNAMEEAVRYLEREAASRSAFKCSSCGSESKEPLWRCPQCRQWDTYIEGE